VKMDGSIEENRKYLKSMEESARSYYEIKKGIRKPKKPKRRLPRVPSDKSNEQKKEEERRKREELKPALIQQNELYHFGPAKTAMENTEAGLNAYMNGDIQSASEKLEEAVEHFELNTDLSFNLGKFYLETGIDIDMGLKYLIEYYLFNNKDHYSSELEKLLHISGWKNSWEGYIDNGECQVGFEVKDDMIYFEEIPPGFTMHLPLSFRVPVSLDMERRDKEKVEMMDYLFLRKLASMDDNENADIYEITINKGSFKPFIKEFYGTIIELSNQKGIRELTPFNDLHIELLKYENYDPGQFGEPKEIAFMGFDDQLVSLIQVEIHKQNSGEFVDLFKGFAQKHLINEKLDSELDQEQDEWEQREQEVYDELTRFEMQQVLLDDYHYYEGQSNLYGEISVILFNLENGIPDPYDTKNEKVFIENKQKYLSLLGGVFDSIRSHKEVIKSIAFGGGEESRNNVDPSQMKLSHLLKEVKSEKVRNTLTSQFDDITTILEKKSHLTMVPMRLTLELILQESSMRLGINLEDGGSKKTLFQLIKEIKRKNKYPRVIDDQMYNIRTMANSSLHYNALEEYVTISKQEVKELVEQLLNVVDYFVKKFQL
jgi:hypothetical protein